MQIPGENKPLARVYAWLGFLVFWTLIVGGIYTIAVVAVVAIDAHNEAINYIDQNLTNVQ